MRFNVCTILVLFLILLTGCTQSENEESIHFKQVEANGADLANVMGMQVWKWEYSGKETRYKWNVIGEIYTQDDRSVKRISLGGGGCGFTKDMPFYIHIPAFEGGESYSRMGGMSTHVDIDGVKEFFPDGDFGSGSGSSRQGDFSGERGEDIWIGAFALTDGVSLVTPMTKYLAEQYEYPVLMMVYLVMEEYEEGDYDPHPPLEVE
jgi:hypothetical protein